MPKGQAMWILFLTAFHVMALAADRGRGIPADSPGPQSSVDGNNVTSQIVDWPIPNERVKRYLESSGPERQRVFDDLDLDDALDAAAYKRMSHPPDRRLLKDCFARFGRDVIPGLVRRMTRVAPNSDIEVTLEMLQEA